MDFAKEPWTERETAMGFAKSLAMESRTERAEHLAKDSV